MFPACNVVGKDRLGGVYTWLRAFFISYMVIRKNRFFAAKIDHFPPPPLLKQDFEQKNDQKIGFFE